MRVGKLKITFTVVGILILLFFVLPIFSLFVPLDELLGGEWAEMAHYYNIFLQALTDVATWRAVGVSVFAAFTSVIVAFIFGVPLAYLLAKKDFFGKGIVEGIVDLPLAVPHTVAGIALLAILGSGGIIGGTTEPLLRFQRAFPGIVAAMTFVSASYLINSAKEGFQSVNPRLEKVARNLGASEWESFRRVSFPLALPYIFTGAVMSWARAISEFGAVLMLVGVFPMIAPVLVWSRFRSTGLESAMSVAVVLLLVVLPSFIILRYLGGRFFDRS